MNSFLKSRAVRLGIALLVIGSGPLVALTLAARLGFSLDHPPNPLYVSTLAWLTAWPSAALLALGAWRARTRAHAP